MAQYNIHHTCGHEETVQIYGTNVHGERTSKAEWLESKPCRDCERKAMRDENLAGAAELEGSEKQVSWANDLRAKAIGDIKAKLAKIDTQYIAAPQDWKDAQRAACESIITAMLAEASAKTIIDHRLDLVSHYGAVAQQAAQ
ncbi:hypothetical protein [Bifidobacterium pseudolongum]|uniref:Uncharacterized protein n=1 Tax=Bifidobacterium pseudolongum subsp. globosum TaxID=1690 RepID=A0A2N3QVU6_9BIFI|nr:hypothetical protein [Bifidobacterium pseudolongum]PKU96227.1 hypothetical protein CQR45_0349 [Bifidobacterium pseudolongum subsp. globosum]